MSTNDDNEPSENDSVITPPGRTVSVRDAAARLAAAKAYAKMLALHIRLMEVDLRGRMEADQIQTLTPKGEAGVKLATISWSQGRRSVEVDQEAATAWCRERYPERLVETIHPDFLARLVNPVSKGGAPGDHAVDTETGEVLPWATVVLGNPYISTTTTAEANSLASELLNRAYDQMTGRELPQ